MYFRGNAAKALRVLFNLKLEILFLWFNKEPLWMNNILSVPLQKRLNYIRNFQKNQIKGNRILKRLEMHNSIAKNHRKKY
jgi:hypothetical protein